ncbi:MAG: hypothetical protein ACJ768_07490 [Gaiellaceae bacterium]
MFTEFGYLNSPIKDPTKKPKPGTAKCKRGNDYWHTEARRGGLYRTALSIAYSRRTSSNKTPPARWMVLYQATEIPPSEYQNPKNPKGYGPDYGVMSRNAEITGDRLYGQDTSKPRKNRKFSRFDFSQPRRAYCAIRSWAKSNGYSTAPNECGP